MATTKVNMFKVLRPVYLPTGEKTKCRVYARPGNGLGACSFAQMVSHNLAKPPTTAYSSLPQRPAALAKKRPSPPRPPTLAQFAREFQFLKKQKLISCRPSQLGTERFSLYMRATSWRKMKRAYLRIVRGFLRKPVEVIIPRDNIPRGVVQPTSRKQVKVRADRTSFAHEEYTDTPYQQPEPKIRDPVLVMRLRMKILLLQSRRLPGSWRMSRFTKLMQKFQNSYPEVYREAEAQGLFSVDVGAKTQKVLDDVVEKITMSVKEVSDAMTSKVVTNISAVAGILVTAASANNRVTWVTGILSSLAVTSIINWNVVCDAMTHFTPVLTKQPESSSENTGKGQSDLADRLDAENTVTCASALTVLFQGIGTYCGISSDFQRDETTLRDWAKIITKNLQFNARSTSGLFSFFRHFIYVIKSMVKWCYGILNPEVQPIINFWEHSAILRELFREATDLRIMNVNEFSDINNMARLDAVIVLLNEIIVRISGFDAKSNGTLILNHCTQLARELIDKRAECARLGMSSTSTIPPYCVYFKGNHGIGKSMMLNDLAPKLEEICGVSEKVRGKYYCRNAGLKYWDGHVDQEVIIYDDFAQFNQSDPDNTDIQEIFQLVTDQPFRPPCADIPNKGKIITAKLVLIAANVAHPKRNYIHDQGALWRRRNKLIEVSLVGNEKPTMNTHFDPEYKHLQFRIYGAVDDENCDNFSASMNFGELVTYLQEDARLYMAAQKSRVEARMRQYKPIVHGTRNEPLTAAALETALIEVLKSNPELSPWSLIYNVSNHVQQIKQWLRKYFPFMYKEPQELEKITSDEDNLIELSMIIHDYKSKPVDDVNMWVYLCNDRELWNSASEDRRREVYDMYKATCPTIPFPFPDYEQKITGVTGTGQADEPTPTSSEESKKKAHELEEAALKAAHLVLVNKMNETKPADGKVWAPFDALSYTCSSKFPEQVTPLLEYFMRYWAYSGQVLPPTQFAELMKKLNIIACDHTKINLDWASHELAFASVYKFRNVHYSFPYYACGVNCVLRNNNILRCLQLLAPQVYRRIADFSKDEKLQQSMKIDSKNIVLHNLSLYARVRDWLKESYQKYAKKTPRCMQWLWQLLKWLLMLLIPIGILLCLVFGYKSWKTTDPEMPYVERVKEMPSHIKNQFMQAYTSKGKTILNPYHGITESEAAYTIAPRQPGGTSIQQQHIGVGNYGDHTNIVKLVKNASTFIKGYGNLKTTGEATTFNFRVFRICGNYIMMPKHYFIYLRTFDIDSLKLYFMLPDTSVEVSIRAFKVLNISNSEMMIITIPNIPRSRDLRSHFCSNEMYMYSPIPSAMSIIEKDANLDTHIHHVATRLIQNFSLTCFGDIMITLPDAIAYDWGGAGRCMSILMCNSGKIRGFHIAGNGTKKGYAQIVTMDTLMELGDAQNPPELPFVDPLATPITQIDTSVEKIGTAQAAFKIHLPNDTSIRKSDIHGIFPVRTMPAPLRPCKDNGYTNPLELGIRKHGLPPLGFDAYHMDLAEQRFAELLLSRVKPIWADVRVRSLDLAIRGVEATPGFRSLVLSTSEGFPYMCQRPAGGSNKRWLICSHEDSFGLHPQLTREYEKNMQMRKNNEIPPTVFVDCLKDARLPTEKALTPGKVRIFSVAPTDFVLAFRQYFADFIVAFTHARFNMFHAIGIAPEKDDWTELVRHLTEVGDKFLCGDYKNFGPGFDHGVHKAVYRSVIKWYETYSTVDDEQLAEDQTVRKIMHIELSEPIHIAHDVVYKTFSGMCSGSPTTTPDNSMVNFFYILLAWINIMSEKNPKLLPLDVMLKYVRIVTYGDDIIMCVNDAVIDIFNNVSLHEFFKRYNIEYTDALKTGEIRPYCSLAEATFLKRSFVPHPYHKSTFLGALEKISVEDCANWINKTVDTQSASVEASYACLQLAYGHGPKYFNWIRDKLIKAWRDRNVIFTPRTWDDYEFMYRGCDKITSYLYIGEGQGPPTSTPGETTVCEESKDTIIQDHVEPDVTCPPAIKQHVIDWAGADYDANYERLLNRYVLVETYPWKKSDVRDSNLIKKVGNVERKSEWTLPFDAIKNNINTPTVLPFLQHRYANFDMDIKIVANVNKFMVGQLQASWYYLADEDAGYKFRNHVYSRSQLMHAIIDAGTSNSVNICVPFKNFRPWINTGKDQNLGGGLKLGRLVLKVLSQLTVPSTVYTECSVSVYVKFTNGSFMGVIPRDLNNIEAEGQMLPMLTTVAASYLMQKMADGNRDKPPVQLPPVHMQPVASSSLGVGTGCSEPLQAMRLDARGQCPHPDSGDSNMDLLNIAQQPGLLTVQTWKSSHIAGDKIWDISVTPTIPRDVFQTVQLRSKTETAAAINGYCVPPVSVIAGLMSEWRGSLDFEFHVVGSQYHTGRLLCCFIPAQVDSLTLSQAQALPYVVYDIHDERKFTFTTPYIADKPWWPCGYLNGQKTEPPGIGKLFLLVLNPLIPMDSVANDLDILIYVKASKTFEIAIPRQSVWGLPWNIETKQPDVVYARDGYYPWYAGDWRFINGGKSFCLRYGPVSDHVAQFSGLRSGTTGASGGWCSYYLDKTDPNYKDNSAVNIGNTTLGDCDFIPVDVGDGYGLIYLGVIKSTDLRIATNAIFPKEYDGKVKANYTKLMAYTEATGYIKGNPRLLRRDTPNPPSVIALSSDSEIGEGNIQICEPTPPVTSTNCGMDLFGESYADGKDYLRRYEPLFRIAVPPPSKKTSVDGEFHLAMDVLPAGYDVPVNNPYSQTSRDGGQAIVASCFRFFRGSMNFKFVTNHMYVTIFLEHRPDRRYTSSMFRPAGLTPRDSKWTKNYAQCILSASVNKIITINVPFYQMGTLGLLQRPNPTANDYALRAYSLGELLVGIEYDDCDQKKENVTIDIFKSIGDDMRFYTYTGFPCMVYIGDLIK